MTDAASVCFLLPGTLCDERLFDPMQSFWPSSGSHTRHLVASLHGLTPDVTPWLQKQLRALPDQFNVMGFSLGVILALRMIELAPERVQCLVLVAGNASAGTAAHRERARTQMQIWQREGPQTLAQQMIDQASPQASQNPMVRQTVLQMANDTPEAAFIAQSEVNVSRPDGLNTLSNWHGPLLLVSGANDPWCGADKQNLMQSARPDAQWHEFAECGHYIPLERPSELAQLTHRFLQEHKSNQRHRA